MTGEDIAAVLAINGKSRETVEWSRADYERACREWDAWVAERAGDIAGFLVARRVADEMEILNLAVDPASRRSGVGSSLLAAALALGRQAGAQVIFLEVRESNLGAGAFYGQHGFALAGRRRDYYDDPREDALVLKRALD